MENNQTFKDLALNTPEEHYTLSKIIRLSVLLVRRLIDVGLTPEHQNIF